MFDDDIYDAVDDYVEVDETTSPIDSIIIMANLEGLSRSETRKQLKWHLGRTNPMLRDSRVLMGRALDNILKEYAT